MVFPPPRQLVADAGYCVLFFTRLPLPRLDFGGRRLGEAIWAAPLAGLAVAIVGGAVYALAAWAGVSAGVAAALALAATMLVTGCLHEDGLSDTVDGFGGGATRERALEIMRDSRIGAYGASALLVSALIRWSAITDLGSPAQVLLGLAAAHAASRALLPAFMHVLPPARSDGLGAGAGRVGAETASIALAIGALTLLLLGPGGFFAAFIVLGAAFFAFRILCLTKIGGQTGDTVGAMQQIGEIAVLVVAAAFLS